LPRGFSLASRARKGALLFLGQAFDPPAPIGRLFLEQE